MTQWLKAISQLNGFVAAQLAARSVKFVVPEPFCRESRHLILTFFGCAKKVNKERRRLTISASSWKSALIRADIRHPRAIRKSILGSLANSLPCRQVKQARLKASKNTFAHNRLGRGYKNKKHLKNLKSQKPSFQSGSAWNP